MAFAGRCCSMSGEIQPIPEAADLREKIAVFSS